MKKFFSLLKKEVRELLTLQMILPMLIGIIAFIFIGNIVGSENKKVMGTQKIIINDLDKSTMSADIVSMLNTQGFVVESHSEKSVETLINQVTENNIPVVISIPEGFEEGITGLKQQKLENYSIIKSFTVFGSMASSTIERILQVVNDYLSIRLISEKTSAENPEVLKTPVSIENYTIINNKTARINPGQLMGFLSSQIMFIPIIMFIIIIMSSQMIVVSIASEKENKTLETLLSTPIKRISIVTSKMIAAGIVSLLMALAYLFGMNYYIKGITGGLMETHADTQLNLAIQELGLSFDTGSLLTIGVLLFLSILIALAVSLILGVFAEDVKKAQGLVAPIIFIIMIPYMISMFIDLDSTSVILKYFVYAIPFSHTFLASQNVFLQRYDYLLYGILYQLAVFIILAVIAARIFATDRVLTMKLKTGKK
jgi:ABC-2 type transport system permease protein